MARAFAEQLDRHRAGHALARTLAVWGLSQRKPPDCLVSAARPSANGWNVARRRNASRLVGDLAAATDLLVHYLKRDRIPAVVRRPIAACGGRSLLDLVAAGESAAAAMLGCGHVQF